MVVVADVEHLVAISAAVLGALARDAVARLVAGIELFGVQVVQIFWGSVLVEIG